MRAWFYACVCARAHVCFARVCARASVLMPGRLASCSVWQIYSADIAELCAALENLLSAINVGSHEKLKTWELVVWRDVLAAFGLVPKPGACASKPTSPRVFTRRALQHERVSGGPYDGALAFEMWDLWWWHGAEFWPEAVRRYRKAAGIILPGFLEQMGVVAPRQPAPRAARVPPAVRRAGPLASMASFLVAHLERTVGGRFVFVHAHALRQGPDTQMSTGFKSHQDNETEDLIDRSVVVKLTADLPGEPPSRMTVLGAAYLFAYGPAAGAAGHFDARLWHGSVPPKSAREHLKITFFFRRFSTRETRAARGRGVN